MWGKTLAFVILFILAFGLIMAMIPSSFLTGDETVQDQDVLTVLNAADLIVYSNSGSDTMNYQYSSLTDHPDAPQFNASLPEGEYCEIWWGVSGIPDVGTIGKAIEIRHSKDWFWGFQMIENFEISTQDGTKLGWWIFKNMLEDAWDSTTNSSAFYASCSGTSVSIVFKPVDPGETIGEAWDNDHLYYGLSYEWESDQTGFNVLSFIVDLLTFQGIGSGVPGIIGNFIDAMLSTLFWIAIAVVAYVIITAVIPFIPGVGDS
jgi:hypothetical protein